MKNSRLIKIGILFCVIGILLASNSLAPAQTQKDTVRKSLFHLQFVLTISWSASDLEEPMSPGETREVNLTISSMVTRGAFGKLLLRLLDGGLYILHLSIEDSPDWCTAWVAQENLTGVIKNDESYVHNTLLYIHLSDDAPGNYSMGWVKINGTINDKKGPFNIFTLVHSFTQEATLPFVTSP